MLQSRPEKQCVVLEKILQIGQKTGVARKPSMALQAKSFSSVITTEPQPVHCGLVEEAGRGETGEVKGGEKRGWGGEGGGEIDFMSERLPKCPGGLWLQCCTLHLFTAERKTYR